MKIDLSKLDEEGQKYIVDFITHLSTDTDEETSAHQRVFDISADSKAVFNFLCINGALDRREDDRRNRTQQG